MKQYDEKKSNENCKDDDYNSKRTSNRSKRRKRGNGKTKGRTNAAASNSKVYVDNALSWYTRYARLSQAVSNIQFPFRPGMIANTGPVQMVSGSNVVTPKNSTYTMPGVITLNWTPTYGYNKPGDSQNPLSVAATETYARIRSEFSGDLDVDPPDIMLYELALDSIYALIAKQKKIFRLINAFSPDNYITPNGILTGMGFSSEQIAALRKAKMDIWKNINYLVHEIGKFRCPGFMDVMNRHYWLSDNIYTDVASIQGQFYSFNLTGYYKVVTQSDDPTSPPLKLSLFASVATNYSAETIAEDMYEEIHGCINALATWQDAYTINGYLRKAFNPADFFTVDEIDYGEVLTPVYSEEVLTQIENAVALPEGAHLANTDITYNLSSNVMQLQPTFAMPAQSNSVPVANVWRSFLANPILNMHVDEPGPADVIIASRLTQTFIFDEAISPTDVSVRAGTEIITDMKLTVKNASVGSFEWATYDFNSFIGAIQGASSEVVGSVGWSYNYVVAGYANAFRMHPIQRLVVMTVPNAGPTAAVANIIPLGEVHNLAAITPEQMNEVTKVCVLSELNAYSLEE